MREPHYFDGEGKQTVKLSEAPQKPLSEAPSYLLRVVAEFGGTDFQRRYAAILLKERI